MVKHVNVGMYTTHGSCGVYSNHMSWDFQNQQILSKSYSMEMAKPIKIKENHLQLQKIRKADKNPRKITLKSTCSGNPLPVVRTRHFKTSNTPYIRIPGKTLRDDFLKGYFSSPLLVPWFPGPGARLLSKKKTLWEHQKTAKKIWAVIIST